MQVMEYECMEWKVMSFVSTKVTIGGCPTYMDCVCLILPVLTQAHWRGTVPLSHVPHSCTGDCAVAKHDKAIVTGVAHFSTNTGLRGGGSPICHVWQSGAVILLPHYRE